MKIKTTTVHKAEVENAGEKRGRVGWVGGGKGDEDSGRKEGEGVLSGGVADTKVSGQQFEALKSRTKVYSFCRHGADGRGSQGARVRGPTHA